MTTYLFLRLCSYLAKYIPVRFGYFLATVFARMAYLKGGARRRTLFQNLTQVVGGSADQQEVAKIALGSYRNLLKYYYEFVRLPAMANVELSRRVHFDGLEHVDRALGLKRGIILVSGHLGNWDMAGAVFTAKYRRVYSVAEPLQPPQLRDLFTETRAAVRIETIPAAAAMRLVTLLRQGGIVSLICDWDLNGNGVQVSFFGLMTTMPAGPAALALKTGAVVIPFFPARQPDDTLMVRMEEPVSLSVTGDKSRDIAVNTQKIADRLEAAIRMDPSQWCLMQPVWPLGNQEAQ